MKTDAKHTFTVENIGGSNGVYPEVEMKIDGQATISDMLEAFNCFLKVIGYIPPENHYLDYVSDEPVEESNYTLDEIRDFGKENDYKGEF